MKKLIILTILTLLNLSVWSQKIKLTNVLVIGQIEKTEDRYTLEGGVVEMFDQNGVKAKPSLNFLKYGENPQVLAEDSLQKLLASKGIDTYVIISIRGYDQRYKRSTHPVDFKTALGEGNIFPIYREESTNITFEFAFYRNGKLVGDDVLRVSNYNDREGVMKKLRKMLNKRIGTYKK